MMKKICRLMICVLLVYLKGLARIFHKPLKSVVRNGL